MQMKEYRISDLFEKVEVQKIQGKANDFPTQKDNAHNIPLLTSTGSNQGFSRYAAKEDCPTILQDVISIASNGDAGATFYQAEPFAVLQDAYAIQLKAHKMTEAIGLYLAAAIRKAIYDTHDWVNKAGWSNIKDSIITLPSVTHIVPDWAMMAQIGGGEMNNFDTSTWKEFLVKDLFRFENPKGKLTTKDLIEGNDIPYIAAKKTNNGVAKMCSRANIPDDQVMKGNCIVFVQQGDGSAGYTTYQKEDFYAISCVTCGYIDGIMNESIGLFLVSVLDKNKAFYNHSNSWSGDKLLNTKILLPATETYEPDWNYMQERIAELEQERIAELEQYLIATGLNDYELTEEDKHILATKLTDGGASQSSESGSGCWKEARKFKLDDLFNSETGNIDIKKDDIGNSGINVVSAGAGNCGIVGKTTLPSKTFCKNTITIDMFGNAFYQVSEYTMVTHARVFNLIPKTNGMSEQSGQYIVSLLKWMSSVFGFNNMCSWNKIHEYEILLPVFKTGQPDWDFMDKYIHAIEKAVIADVVKYKDEIIMNTKAIA